MRSISPLLAAVAACSVAAVAQAQEWPRYHVGVGIGVGRSHLGTSWKSAGVPEPIRPNRSLESGSGWPWRLSAGFRPVRIVGAELEYVDFGDAEAEDGYSPNQSVSRGSFTLRSRVSATVLTAVFFIPDPSPSFDFYGKVGVAKLEESFDVHVSNWELPCRLRPFGQAPECLFDNQGDRSDSHAYVGIGARFKVARHLAARVEYEAIDGDVGGKPTMFSLSFAWER
jgi:opacity protein-like surface antigen